MSLGILAPLLGAPVAIGSAVKQYVDGKNGSSGSGSNQGPIVGYANGKPIYQNTAMNGVDTSGMGTKAQQQAAGTAEGKTAATMGGYNPATLPASSATPTAPQQTLPTYGTASGPGIMQQWFGSMASGQNPAWDYMNKRASTALDNAYGARGAFNSGAALQGQSDLKANENAQEMGLLDTMAQGASNEQQNQINQMFGVGMGLAGGGAGLAGGYDTGAAGAMSSANGTAMNLGMQGAMVPYLANQNFMNNMFGLGGAGLGAALG